MDKTEEKKISHFGVKLGRGVTKGALEQLKDYIFSPTGIILIIGAVIIIYTFKKHK